MSDMAQMKAAYRKASQDMSAEMEKVETAFNTSCPAIANLMQAADVLITALDNDLYIANTRFLKEHEMHLRLRKAIRQILNMAEAGR